MAKKVILVDDLTGDVIKEEHGGGTVRFSVEGTAYTLDLSAENRLAFNENLKKWIDAATEVEREPVRHYAPAPRAVAAKPTGSGLSKEELQAVRDWAGKNGYDVAPRGRIKAEILEAYEEAHKG